ncbi:hypothetical protein [Undibacterium danionis]|uniref:DUF4239 domain-containing protein n=1 Tax=Undibacterium danionis TaxID=1812100 RepID=A0ABV6IEZ7_9BURK
MNWAIGSIRPDLAWLVSLAMIIATIAFFGSYTLGTWKGILIDRRNVISLSRLQMTSWTVVITSALLTMTIWRIWSGTKNPLDLNVPPELWVLMGIATTSSVGASLVINAKASSQEPNEEQFSRTKNSLAAQGDDPSNIGNHGVILINKELAMARWTDMITGDETGNAAHLDLSKVQMLLFTIVSIVVYSLCVWNALHCISSTNPKTIDGLPLINQTILALIGISHSGYLTSKAVGSSELAK